MLVININIVKTNSMQQTVSLNRFAYKNTDLKKHYA